MSKTAVKRFKWALLIAVTFLLFAVMFPVANARRRYAATRALLVECRSQGRIPVMKQLIAQGADVNGHCVDDCPPFDMTTLYACADNQTSDPIKTLKTLLDAGADVNLATDDGTTALMRAVRVNSPELAAFLIAHGADVNRRTDAIKFPTMPITKRMSALDLANYYSTPGFQKQNSTRMSPDKLNRIKQMLIKAGAK